MSDLSDRRREARQLDAEAGLWRRNARAHERARRGPPGDPPELLCEDCGRQEDECRCPGPGA